MKEKRYVPDPYCNRIAFRVPQKEWSVLANSPMEANFATWEEAWKWLIQKRTDRLRIAEVEVVRAKSHLNRALKMKRI